MRIAIFTETLLVRKNTAAANQAAVLQKGLQQLGHKVLIVTGSTKATEIILDKGMLCCLLVNPIISIVKVLIKYMHICWTIT